MTVRWIDDNPRTPGLPIWTRGFAAELFRRPVTPLGWDLIWEGTALSGWRDVFVDRLGFPPDELDPERPALVGLFDGHLYLNASTLRVLAARTPGLAPDHFDLALGLARGGLPSYRPAEWHTNTEQTDGPLAAWLGAVLAAPPQAELDAGRVLALETVGERPSLELLSDTELVERASSLRPLCRALVAHHVNQTLAATVGPGVVAAVCAAVDLPATATELISGIGEIELTSPVHGMWTLSRLVRNSPVLLDAFEGDLAGLRGHLAGTDEVDALGFLAGFDALLAEVGHRAVEEWDLAGATWERDTEQVLVAIDRLRVLPDSADPGARLAAREMERTELARRVAEAVAHDAAAGEQFLAAVRSTTTFLRGRARSKATVNRVINEMRVVMRELGTRAAGRGDVGRPDDLTMLFLDELDYYADGGLSAVGQIVSDRLALYEKLTAATPPDVLDHAAGSADGPGAGPAVTDGAMLMGEGGVAWFSRPDEAPPAPLRQGEVLLGKPASAGVERGRARVITDPADIGRITEDEVLVTDLPVPLWLPHLVGVVGVVTDGGSPLSHTVVVTRELGIPAVVGTHSGTARIPDGAVVEIDGLGGMVTVLEAPLDAHVVIDESAGEPFPETWP